MESFHCQIKMTSDRQPRKNQAEIIHSCQPATLIFTVTFTMFQPFYAPAFFRSYLLEFKTEPFI